MKLYKQTYEAVCGSTEELRAFFDNLGVAPTVQGVAKDGEFLMELWKTASNDFWAVVMTNPNDLSCILSFGPDFMELIWFLPGSGV